MPATTMPQLSRVAARATAAADTVWIPLGEGRAFKPIRFLRGDRGYVALMHIDPGTVIPPHRHTGEVHAFNISGTRELHTGERIGPGDYVYEPPGNLDTWKAVGNEPAIVLIVVQGTVEYLGPAGEVTRRFSGASLKALYTNYCIAHGITALDLTD